MNSSSPLSFLLLSSSSSSSLTCQKSFQEKSFSFYTFSPIKIRKNQTKNKLPTFGTYYSFLLVFGTSSAKFHSFFLLLLQSATFHDATWNLMIWSEFAPFSICFRKTWHFFTMHVLSSKNNNQNTTKTQKNTSEYAHNRGSSI